MTAKCHVCGVGAPENPSVQFPVCHACRRALWERSHYAETNLAGLETEARERLFRAVVNLRRIHAARRGVASLSPFHPTPP